MQGILFFDRMSDEVLDSIRADLQVKQNFTLNYVYSIHTVYFAVGRISMRMDVLSVQLPYLCVLSLSVFGHIQALEKKYEESTGLPSPERIEKRRTRKAAVGFGKS